jgi:tRNA pseudouridine55 synthase
MARTDGPDGLAVVDKPVGPTSHDVVAQMRRLLHTRRVGHSGTLDPGASGLLLLGVGRVTRLLRFLTALGKSYEGELVLGTETTTLDAAGEVSARHDMAGVTLAEVRTAAAGFVGDILQVPPMVSALKVGGRRLHELARAGIEVERVPRPITIGRIDVESTDDPVVFTLAVDCSSGTYIRTLAADLGQALGGGAHLRNLRRTAIGTFTLREARPPEAVSGLLSPAEALRDYPSVTLDDEGAAVLARSGRLVVPDAAAQAQAQGPFRVLDGSGRLLAVAEERDGRLRPAVVLPPLPASA